MADFMRRTSLIPSSAYLTATGRAFILRKPGSPVNSLSSHCSPQGAHSTLPHRN
jgi:hypothetical protein